MKPKQIPRPAADEFSFTPLTPLQLNAFRFSDKRTILTPELLEEMASRGSSPQTNSDATQTVGRV